MHHHMHHVFSLSRFRFCFWDSFALPCLFFACACVRPCVRAQRRNLNRSGVKKECQPAVSRVSERRCTTWCRNEKQHNRRRPAYFDRPCRVPSPFCPRPSPVANASCNTFLFILQNDWGADTWPVSTETLTSLQEELESEARVHADRN